MQDVYIGQALQLCLHKGDDPKTTSGRALILF